MNKRIGNLLIFVGIIFLFLLLSVVKLQILQYYKYLKLAKENRIRLIHNDAPRGLIYDRKGRLLVANKGNYAIRIFADKFKKDDKFSENLNILVKILGLDSAEIQKKIKEATGFEPIEISDNVTINEASLLAEKLSFNGFFIEMIPVRYYLFNNLAAHILGYVGKMNKKEFKKYKNKGYNLDELIGKAGLEKYYNKILRGKQGGKQVEVNAAGQMIADLGEKEPVPGKDIIITLDIDIQKKVEEVINNLKAAVVVMDPNNGEILAIASSPTFSPKIFTDKIPKKIWQNLISNEQHPLHNRATNSAYPPGSTFKIITALAALQEKKVKTADSFYCPGYYKIGNRTYKCWKRSGHGHINFYNAIANSCDVVFYQLATRLGHKLITKYAKLLGLGKKTQIDLPQELAGFLPSAEWKKKQFRDNWYLGDTANLGIGQGFMLVTPLQMAKVVSFFATGKLVHPHILRSIKNKELNNTTPINYLNDYINLSAINPYNIKEIRKGMLKAVQIGTAKAVYFSDLSVAGKTGTSQDKTYTKPHAWFIGFAPFENPKVALAIVVENGGEGGRVAVPIAAKILKKMQSLGYFR